MSVTTKLLRIAQRLPLSTATKLAISRTMIERGYAEEIGTALRSKDYEAVSKAESWRRHELDLQDEEEDAYLTRRLLSAAHRLRVPIPRSTDHDGETSAHWYRGSQTGGHYLSDLGIKALREEIRLEQKSRHEIGARYVIWITAATGLVGAATGFIAILGKR